MEIIKKIPWWMKVFSKITLSRLGIPYQQWRQLGIFMHGSMLDHNYALDVFHSHYSNSKSYLPDKFSVLELGPGDSLSTAFIASSLGSKEIWLVDSGSFASLLKEDYKLLFESLKISEPDSLEEFLTITNSKYLINGLDSLRKINSNSIDFIFSNAVLEHIYIHEFNDTIKELFRIQKPGGVSSHTIDFQDHLSKSLNSFRFSRKLWEADWFARSGFYTNRLRASQVSNCFIKAGYEILSNEFDCWEELPLSRKVFHPEFDDLSDKDLLILGMDLIVQKEIKQ